MINDLSKLKWACRRGMLELDVLLSNFLNERYLSLPDTEKQQFVNLLACTDPELFAWLLGSEMPPTEFQSMIKQIREHAKTRIQH